MRDSELCSQLCVGSSVEALDYAASILSDSFELFCAVGCLRAKMVLKFGAIAPLCLLVCADPSPATFFRSEIEAPPAPSAGPS
jgi:hypothetical protein